MSKFIIASEENLEHLAHYGVKGMKWREKKAIKNTSAMTRAAAIGATKGQDASIKAEEIARKEKTKEFLGNMLKGYGNLVKKVGKKYSEAKKETVNNIKNGVTNYIDNKYAPINTISAKRQLINGGGMGAEVAVKEKQREYKRNKAGFRKWN